MLKKRILYPKPSKNRVKKFLISVIIIFLLLFVAVGLIVYFLVVRYQSSFAIPTTVVFLSKQSSADAANHLLVLNLSQDDTESGLFLLSGQNLPVIDKPYEFTAHYGVLSEKIIKLDYLAEKESLKQDLANDVLDQIKALDRNLGYTALALVMSLRGKVQFLYQEGRDLEFFKTSFKMQFKSSGLFSAQCPITVSNATRKSGLATQVADLLTTQGGVVVRVINHDQVLDNTTVLIDQEDKNCLQLAKLLASSFSQTGEVSLVKGLFFDSRSQIEIRIGEDATER